MAHVTPPTLALANVGEGQALGKVAVEADVRSQGQRSVLTTAATA